MLCKTVACRVRQVPALLSRLRRANIGLEASRRSFIPKCRVPSRHNGQYSTGAPNKDTSDSESSDLRQRVWGGVSWWKPIWDEIGTIPNAITLSRLAATPLLAYLILAEQYEVAFGGLVVFGFSDWLDGYIARTYDQTSVLGTFLDPFADKVLLLLLFVVVVCCLLFVVVVVVVVCCCYVMPPSHPTALSYTILSS